MGKVTTLQIKNDLLTRTHALGNSSRGLKDVASDLINQYGTQGPRLKQICAGTFLSPVTIQRLSQLTETEAGDPYSPHSDTIERVLRFFGAEVHFVKTHIAPKFQNKAKHRDE